MEYSDEDKLIANAEMFFLVRTYIRQKKPSAETISKIENVLKKGADINACDANENNNTILHIAVQKEEKDVVIYLLQKGAQLSSNKDEKTALHLALEKNTSLGKEIAEILSKQNKLTVCNKNGSVKKQENESNSQKTSIIRAVSVQEVNYQKRAGTSGVSGQFYETKLLSLVLHRALHDKEIEQFYLAANIKDIGDFDDVCFRYKNVACFMQTKHRENTDKAKLSVANIRSTTGKLGLGIYFDSFLKIRQKFTTNASDPMFQGKFEDIESYFVLYTPLKECFERKLFGNNQMNSKMHSIIYTGDKDVSKETDMFQFDYEVRDLDFLTDFIKHEHIKILGKTFLEFILSNNKLGVMMASDLVKIYHPALAQKVISIQKVLEPLKSCKASKNIAPNNTNASVNSNIPNFIHRGKFCPEFFYSEDPNLITLRNTFFKEIVFTHSPKTVLSKEEVKQKIKEIAINPCPETISYLIGSPIKFDDTNDKLTLDINKLPKNKYKLDEIQQIRYDLQKIQVTRSIVRDAVYLAGQKKLETLTFELPQSFGNIDLNTNQKTFEGLQERLNFLAGKFHSLINYFAERNANEQIKIIDLSNEVVGPGKILEHKHLSSNGGIGGAVGNLLEFDTESKLFKFNTQGVLGENARYLLEKLQQLTGENLTKYRIKVIIDGFPRASFDTYQYDTDIASEFYKKLWFYTNQAQEESVETTLKKEINKHYNADKQRNQFLFHVHSDAIFLRFHDEIQKWWKKPTEAHYLSKNTLIFENAKKGIVDNPLLTVLNVMFIRKIKQLSIEFNITSIDSLNLDECIDKDTTLNIVSDAVMLTAAKILQCTKYQNKYTFINLDYIHILPQNDYETMMEELKLTKDSILVIITETPLRQNLQDTLMCVLKTYTTAIEITKKKIIIITGEPFTIDQSQILQNYEYVSVKDMNINLIDLTKPSQTYILDQCCLTYQGQDVKLNTVIDEYSKRLINAKLLWSLLNKEKIEIGQTLHTHKYNEIKKYYINRSLKYNDEEYAVNTLDDIDDKIVLISSKPCMGKSILLTHLSLETKKVDPKPWIVLINMSTHDKDFQAINKNDINKAMVFLSKATLKNFKKDVHFSVTDNGKITINSENPEDISFELQLFIHLYNSDNIIFLFDGFDKVYPQNTNEGLELFTVLENANKRMWITSDCYVIKVLERRFKLLSYKLERLPTIQQKSFLERFWATNLKLEKLNHQQFNNITLFFDYILRIFNRQLNISEGVNDRPIMPLLSVPLHIIYLTLLDYFKNEVHNLSPCYLRETIKKKWRLNRYTAFDRYLGRSDEEKSLELAGTPLHMYIAANYFAFQITDKFDLHLDTQMIHDRSNIYINAVTLYERFLKQNIKNICEIENKTAAGDNQDQLRDDFFDSHKKLAIYAICKENDISKILTEPEIREVKATIKMIESGEIKTHLIDSVVDGIPRFYHLLFAEYFIVETLSDMLKRMKNNNFHCLNLDSFCDFFVNIILVTSSAGLRNAFEYKLKYDPELAEVATNDNCNKIMFELLLKPNQARNGDASTTENALNVAINEGLVHITNFFLRGIRYNIKDDNVERLITVLKSSAQILEVADTSRSILSDNILRCIKNVDGESIMQVLNSNNIGKELQNNIKTNIVTPVKRITEKLVQFSGHNPNLVALVEQFPYHLSDFLGQLNNEE